MELHCVLPDAQEVQASLECPGTGVTEDSCQLSNVASRGLNPRPWQTARMFNHRVFFSVLQLLLRVILSN